MRLLTPKQAAERGCLSESTIYALLKARRIPAMRVGCTGRGKWLIPEGEFDLFIQSCRVCEPEPEDDGAGEPASFKRHKK